MFSQIFKTLICGGEKEIFCKDCLNNLFQNPFAYRGRDRLKKFFSSSPTSISLNGGEGRGDVFL